MKKLLFVVVIILFSVPVFAEDEDIFIIPPTQSNTITHARIRNLMQEINAEFDRISNNWLTHEDYDITDPLRDIILEAVFPPGIENATEKEKDIWARGKVPLFESFNEYVENLPDGERKIMFTRAKDLIWELTFVD